MFGEKLISVIVISGVGSALVIGFSFPALTTSGGGRSNTVIVQEKLTQERAHCEAFGDGADCACFAKTAGYILSHDQPEVYGFNYADRQDLARDQASSDC